MITQNVTGRRDVIKIQSHLIIILYTPFDFRRQQLELTRKNTIFYFIKMNMINAELYSPCNGSTVERKQIHKKLN